MNSEIETIQLDGWQTGFEPDQRKWLENTQWDLMDKRGGWSTNFTLFAVTAHTTSPFVRTKHQSSLCIQDAVSQTLTVDKPHFENIIQDQNDKTTSPKLQVYEASHSCPQTKNRWLKNITKIWSQLLKFLVFNKEVNIHKKKTPLSIFVFC